jgi:hypothetical protein
MKCGQHSLRINPRQMPQGMGRVGQQCARKRLLMLLILLMLMLLMLLMLLLMLLMLLMLMLLMLLLMQQRGHSVRLTASAKC